MQGAKSEYEGYRHQISLKGDSTVVARQQYCGMCVRAVRYRPLSNLSTNNDEPFASDTIIILQHCELTANP